MLLEGGEITREQLQEALKVQEAEGGRLGVVLVKLEFISTATLAGYLKQQAQEMIHRLREDKEREAREDAAADGESQATG